MKKTVREGQLKILHMLMELLATHSRHTQVDIVKSTDTEK